MESEFFINAGIFPSWQSLSSAMEIQGNDLNGSMDKSPDCSFNPISMDQSFRNNNFDSSALSSIVSSPAASNSNVSNESFMIRELIGKLGNIGGSIHNNSGEISPRSRSTLVASYISTTTCNNNNSSSSNNNSCYTTPLSSPPKLNLPVMDRFAMGKPRMGLDSSVAEFTADPGFAERAARFSCFGSRSFNGRTSQAVVNNAELGYRSSPLTGNGKFSRVSSSPSLKELGSQKRNNNNNNNNNLQLQDRSDLANSSQEESSVSEQVPNVETVNSRKRKAVSKAKSKEPAATAMIKDAETNDNSNAKRSKPNEGNGNKVKPAKAEEETKGDGDDKQNKANSKPPEPPKDYIHVRARRGQATDSHSLAERVRREKISERMKLLQDLVPGCNKVTGKAHMLDEIINYVQSLQRQVECLSMKLASVNTRLDFNMETLISKDILQSNNQLPHPIFPLDSAIFGHQPHQNPGLHSNISNGIVTHCSSMDPLDTGLCHNLNMQLPLVDGFSSTGPQFPTFSEDDLHTIVQMGFGQNPNQETVLQPQHFHGTNQESQMKIEL